MKKIQVLIPMAGRGSRFKDGGYELPKPLIDVAGHPMISWVIKNFSNVPNVEFSFVALKEHEVSFELTSILERYVPNPKIIFIDEVTSGAAETCLIGCSILDENEPLIIANSDQYVAADLNPFIDILSDFDGSILTMPASDPKWSYVKLDDDGFVTEVVEKVVISNQATVGIYGFSKATYFIDAAKKMIDSGLKVNNEYYVAPTYNEMYKAGLNTKTLDVGNAMHGLGTPSDLIKFLEGEY